MRVEHLTTMDVDLYVEGEIDALARAEINEHLASCPMCRGRIARDKRLESALRELRRADAPFDLSTRISAMIELRMTQERERRQRLPFVIAATIFSALVTLWFAFQMLVAFENNGVLDFVGTITAHPDLFSSDSMDAIFAIVESLPIGEMGLFLFALLTVLVLAQLWVESVQPMPRTYRKVL